jgi:hypothetical protein
MPEEQAALRRVATLVARGTPPEEVFAAVAGEAGRLLVVDFAVQYDHAQYAVEIVGTWASTGACADPGRQPTGARRAQREHWYTGRACQPGSNTPVSPVCLKFRSYTVAASPAARTARVARLGTDQASR